MNKTLLHITLLLSTLCFGFTACTDNLAQQPDSSGDGQLRIGYKVSGASMTRASSGTEPGLTDWNENKIVRVDLFVFNADGTFHKHIEAAGSDEDPLADRNDGVYTPLTTENLTYDEVKDGNFIYYMVANCPQLADKDIISLNDLRTEMINNTGLLWNRPQNLFVMDGTAVRNIDGENITLSFDLSRAAVKIRLTVLDNGGNDITGQCRFRLHNYVPKTAWVLAREEATASDGNTPTEEQVNAFYDLAADETSISRQSMDSPKLNRGNKVVFYSYPNDWFDESKADLGSDGKWTITNYTTANPIIRERQTYILLEAPYNDETYYYEIPVNLSTYENNDALSFTPEQYKEIRDLYRMQRNHIYDITARIDQRGGGLDLTCNVLEWGDGESIDINYSDGFSGTLTLNTATRKTSDGEALAVVYGDDEKWATFTFRMTAPVAATWTANLTDGSHFELYSATGTASGIGVGNSQDENEGLVTFNVRPTQEYDVNEIYETELYISVISVNGEHMGEQDINEVTKYPGTITRIKIRQVSLDQWNGLTTVGQ